MPCTSCAWLTTLAALLAAAAAAPAGEPSSSRTFLLTYAATLRGLPPGGEFRLWAPVPPSDADQETTALARRTPGEFRLTREPKYGNQILYVAGRADADGTASLELTYRVRRSEVRG